MDQMDLVVTDMFFNCQGEGTFMTFYSEAYVLASAEVTFCSLCPVQTELDNVQF